MQRKVFREKLNLELKGIVVNSAIPFLLYKLTFTAKYDIIIIVNRKRRALNE